MLARPLVVELIDDKHTILVTEFDELTAIGVVRGTDVVHAILLHQQYALLDGTGIGGSTKGTE